MFSSLLKPSLARPLLPIPSVERPSLGCLRLVKSASFRVFARFQRGYRGPVPKKDSIAEWVLSNGDAVRSLPIYVGGFSLVTVLINRTVSLVAPVIDASSNLLPLRYILNANFQDPTDQTGIANFMVQQHDGTVSEWGWCKQKLDANAILAVSRKAGATV